MDFAEWLGRFDPSLYWFSTIAAVFFGIFYFAWTPAPNHREWFKVGVLILVTLLAFLALDRWVDYLIGTRDFESALFHTVSPVGRWIVFILVSTLIIAMMEKWTRRTNDRLS
jgi:hypothetical protein